MDWQKSMNQALDYIENNLLCDIDYYAAAKIMNCSEWEFRRIFSFLAQIPLSEYIRRRRLAMAAIVIFYI
jgi:AraC-like DNA-binding protein